MSTSVIILLVDDEPLIALPSEEALEAGGFTVLLAQSGAEAIEILENRTADIAGLITDIRLGSGPTGWDVAHRARELRPDLPIVYVTGDSAQEWHANGVPKSVLIQKPFAPAQVVSAISALMRDADSNPNLNPPDGEDAS